MLRHRYANVCSYSQTGLCRLLRPRPPAVVITKRFFIQIHTTFPCFNNANNYKQNHDETRKILLRQIKLA